MIPDSQLKKAGLKVTSARLRILQLLQQPDCQHIGAEELHRKLIEQNDEIGLATVYRILNQFDDAGIVTRHHFEGNKSIFELTPHKHHDHLVCLNCDLVIEFVDDLIEARQKHIAEQHQIQLTNHSLHLYGHCHRKNCPNLPK